MSSSHTHTHTLIDTLGETLGSERESKRSVLVLKEAEKVERLFYELTVHLLPVILLINCSPLTEYKLNDENCN